MSQQDPGSANNPDNAANTGQSPYGQPISRQPAPGQYPQTPPAGQLPPGQQPYGLQQYGPPAPQPLSQTDERMWAMLAYVLAILFGFLAPLIIFLVYKDRSAFVRDSSKEALNLSITATIVSLTAFIGLFTIGLGLTIAFPPAGIMLFILWFILLFSYSIAVLVFEIIGAMRANRGEFYRVPYILRLVK
ncbi:MAG: DUF4870 domain-containing protein [Candidatus Nanopelagicales bacterium]